MAKLVRISNKRLAQIIDFELMSLGIDSSQSEEIYNQISTQDGYVDIRESEDVIIEEGEDVK